MSQKNKVLLLSQVVVIVLASVAAVYTFQHVQTSIQIAGISAHYYISYLLAVFLCYFSVYKHNQYIALFLSLLVLVAFFSILFPVSSVMQFLPAITFCLAVVIGVFSVLVVPAERGRYFVTFLIILVLPAILAESQVNWSRFFQDMATLSEIYPFISPLVPLFEILREGFLLLTSDVRTNLYELYTVCFVVVAGYLYLRYATKVALTRHELIQRGASIKDIETISKSILLVAGIVATAVITTALVTVTTPIIVSSIKPLLAGAPLHIFLFGIGTGTAIVATAYMFTKGAVGVLPRKFRQKAAPRIVKTYPSDRPTFQVEASSSQGIRRAGERREVRHILTPWGPVEIEPRKRQWRDKNRKQLQSSVSS